MNDSAAQYFRLKDAGLSLDFAATCVVVGDRNFDTLDYVPLNADNDDALEARAVVCELQAGRRVRLGNNRHFAVLELEGWRLSTRITEEQGYKSEWTAVTFATLPELLDAMQRIAPLSDWRLV